MHNKYRACLGYLASLLVLAASSQTRAAPAPGELLLAFATPPPPAPSRALGFAPPPEPVTAIETPDGARQFIIQYDFNMLVMSRHGAVLTDIFDYADAVRPRHIAVESHRGASLLSDGTVLTEDEGLAERRAREIADILTGAGVDPDTIELGWSETVDPPDGVEDWQSRRTVVFIEP